MPQEGAFTERPFAAPYRATPLLSRSHEKSQSPLCANANSSRRTYCVHHNRQDGSVTEQRDICPLRDNAEKIACIVSSIDTRACAVAVRTAPEVGIGAVSVDLEAEEVLELGTGAEENQTSVTRADHRLHCVHEVVEWCIGISVAEVRLAAEYEALKVVGIGSETTLFVTVP